MSLIVEGRVVIAPPTDELSPLVELAANDIRDDVRSATEEPLTTLSARESCNNVQQEFNRYYEKLVCCLCSLNLHNL